MRKKNEAMEFLMDFMVVTACITVLMGVLGVIFLPDVRFGYEAFFSPPIFGFLSAVLGVVTRSGREDSLRQIIIKKAVHLLLIEGTVFGLNYAAGHVFGGKLALALAFSILAVFVAVHLVLWGNDRRSVEQFNERLKVYQQENTEAADV